MFALEDEFFIAQSLLLVSFLSKCTRCAAYHEHLLQYRIDPNSADFLKVTFGLLFDGVAIRRC